MPKSDAAVVPAYVERQPEHTRKVLRRVRALIRRALPGAEEVLSYGIPAYRRDGRAVVYFAGWKAHWSLYPVTPDVRAALGSRLDGYEVRKGTVRFPLDRPVPAALVERLVRELARAAKARSVAARPRRPASAAWTKGPAPRFPSRARRQRTIARRRTKSAPPARRRTK